MLPDEPARHAEGFTPAEVLSGIREICPTEPQGFGLARETRSDQEAESLISWADEKGALWSEKNVPKTDDLTGGEHLVEIDEDSGRVFKSTKPGKFGFGVDLEMVRTKGWERGNLSVPLFISPSPSPTARAFIGHSSIFSGAHCAYTAAQPRFDSAMKNRLHLLPRDPPRFKLIVSDTSYYNCASSRLHRLKCLQPHLRRRHA